MKHLILWRHADAGDPLADRRADDARALSATGRRQAIRMARWLGTRLPACTRVLSSPAPRAAQTAAALRASVDLEPRLAPGSGVDAYRAALAQAIAAMPDGGALVVVGHQPDLGALAATLLGASGVGFSVRKASAWWLGLREREGSPVVLLAAMDPDLLGD